MECGGRALLWFVVVMTGGRCHRQKKMMGRGADRGCGTEERQCPISRASAKTLAEQPGNPEKDVPLGIDLYAQARKALSDRCPFETEEALANSVSTLPSGLAWLLSKHSDSRKRHKKSHSDTKSSSRQSRGASIWLETEGYFRELALEDIETLVEKHYFYIFCISYVITICYKFLIKIVELYNLICVAICTTNSRNQNCSTCMAS